MLERRQFLMALGGIALLFPLTPAEARVAAAVMRAANEVTEAFLASLEPFRRIGDSAERTYLLNQLTSLSDTLHRLELSKRDAQLILARQPFDKPRLAAKSREMLTQISRFRKILIDLAPRLRQLNIGGMDSAIALLGDAVIEKAALGEELQYASNASRASLQHETAEAVKALRGCQNMLQRLNAILRNR